MYQLLSPALPACLTRRPRPAGALKPPPPAKKAPRKRLSAQTAVPTSCKCPNLVRPACGADGVIHRNACTALCAGAAFQNWCPGSQCECKKL